MKSKIRCSYTKLLAGNVHTIQSSPFTRLLNRFFSYFLFFFLFFIPLTRPFFVGNLGRWVGKPSGDLLGPFRFTDCYSNFRLHEVTLPATMRCNHVFFSDIFTSLHYYLDKKKEKKRKDWDWIVKKKGWNIFETWYFLLQILFHYINGNYFK